MANTNNLKKTVNYNRRQSEKGLKKVHIWISTTDLDLIGLDSTKGLSKKIHDLVNQSISAPTVDTSNLFSAEEVMEAFKITKPDDVTKFTGKLIEFKKTKP